MLREDKHGTALNVRLVDAHEICREIESRYSLPRITTTGVEGAGRLHQWYTQTIDTQHKAIKNKVHVCYRQVLSFCMTIHDRMSPRNVSSPWLVKSGKYWNVQLTVQICDYRIFVQPKKSLMDQSLLERAESQKPGKGQRCERRGKKHLPVYNLNRISATSPLEWLKELEEYMTFNMQSPGHLNEFRTCDASFELHVWILIQIAHCIEKALNSGSSHVSMESM
ncbi:hypothetical protein TNCV_1639361 [Trichonephila clavipes]|nr:hypothetical protein TNCV_1639361 [Trichonephila clavipes]